MNKRALIDVSCEHDFLCSVSPLSKWIYVQGLACIALCPTWMHQMYGLSARLLYKATPCQHWWFMIRQNNSHSNTEGITTPLPRTAFLQRLISRHLSCSLH